MKKILVSGLGTADVTGLVGKGEENDKGCPLVSLLTNPHFGPFAELCLFISHEANGLRSG